MGARDEAQTLVRRLAGLGGGLEIVRKRAAAELSAREPAHVGALVEALVALAQGGDASARSVLAAVLEALRLELRPIPELERVREAAELAGQRLLGAILTQAPPARELDEDAAARRDARQFSQSLGHLKQKARLTRNPDELARLMTFSNPAVVRNVLINPRLTEELVVRIASRRPARPEPLVEIWKSRWGRRHPVQRALALNPYLPPEIGSKILPLLNRAELEQLAQESSLHLALRQEARLLLERGGGAA